MIDRIILVGILGSLLLAGCDLDFKDPHKVEDLRVLAVAAEPPEIAPGEGTSVSVLWADPEGEGRTVDFVWWICGGFAYGADLEACEMIEPPIRTTNEEGGDRMDIPVTPNDILDKAELPEGIDSITLTFVGLLCADGKLPSDEGLENPKNIDHIDALCKDGEAVSFFRTIIVSESNSPQENPGIDRVTANGESLVPLNDEASAPNRLTCKKKGDCDVDVELFLSEGSQQTYEEIEYGEIVDMKERLYVSWYVTDGEFDDGGLSMVDRSLNDSPLGPFETVWQPEKPGRYMLYTVAHDVRGGVDWQKFAIELEPAS